MRFAFFGTPDIARIVLAELEHAGYVPSIIITNPDAPIGRKQVLTPPPVKMWAAERGLPVIQPTTLKNPDHLPELVNTTWDFFVVAAYGKIMPQWLLDIPQHGTLNVHPSLLPALRGASPIRSAILEDRRKTGVTIMLMDAQMDHGPILAQERTDITELGWPVRGRELDRRMATQGGRFLAAIIPEYLEGNITPQEQDHTAATFCTKITKDMSELALDPKQLPTGQHAYEYLLKVRAFDGWPETFFIHEGKRVKIKDAELRDGIFYPTLVVPEGKKEITFQQYLNTFQTAR